ncbi:hypothetical protein [Phycicoccus flavus]|uniref:hypothetical protein n=1 Tax=Phycicoccus flavus TaxID=2502783 RepID=UPI000FEBD115|nr:hypothetical protein [Phycicoccus flavus]NHA70089.1 hypothetical protein [Phycicoccus flavus]
MSDNWIRVIPTSPSWQPEPEAAKSAVDYLSGLFAGPDNAVDDVRAELHKDTALIDSGVNTASFTCAACSAVTGVEWVLDLVNERCEDLSDLDVHLPCCGAHARLNDLDYDWPMGFARFEIGVLNARRARYELDEAELHEVGRLVGHPVRQVLAHY